LDANDKFCRECGLPTMRHAAERKRVPAAPPDTGEMRRALNAQPEPAPFARSDDEPTPPPETTGDVVRATSPTQAVQMASSTVLMLIALMVVLAVAGAILLAVALR
jgi:hypothetical protein